MEAAPDTEQRLAQRQQWPAGRVRDCIRVVEFLAGLVALANVIEAAGNVPTVVITVFGRAGRCQTGRSPIYSAET